MYWTDTYHQGNDRLNGKADEVEFFNRALSADEIAAIYNAGSAGKCRPCAAPPSGLVSWWGGDNNALDRVGGFNGTLHGDTTYAAGKVGQSFSFDGNGDYVSIPQSANLPVRGTNSFTIDAWVKNSDGSMFNVFAYRPSDPNQNLQFYVTATNTSIWVPEHHLAQINHNVDSTTWNHFAYVRDGNTWRLYVNGLQVGSDIVDTVDLGNPTSTQNIGGPGCVCGQWANGQIDEVEIFNRALSANEIAAIYNAGSAGKCVPDRTPDQFQFTDITNASLSTVYESNTITVVGIDNPTPVSVTGGEYAISTDGGSSWSGWTNAAGTVNLNDRVKVRQTSSPNFSTATNTTLTIGGVSDTFSVTTRDAFLYLPLILKN